jgi:hypothetical protein
MEKPGGNILSPGFCFLGPLPGIIELICVGQWFSSPVQISRAVG